MLRRLRILVAAVSIAIVIAVTVMLFAADSRPASPPLAALRPAYCSDNHHFRDYATTIFSIISPSSAPLHPHPHHFGSLVFNPKP